MSQKRHLSRVQIENIISEIIEGKKAWKVIAAHHNVSPSTITGIAHKYCEKVYRRKPVQFNLEL